MALKAMLALMAEPVIPYAGMRREAAISKVINPVQEAAALYFIFPLPIK